MKSASSTGIFRRTEPVIAAAVFLTAVAVWLNLPSTVIVFNDDFGYLRSIVETLQHGRPWTDDWLEPWAASLSVLSAGVFKVTGSFRLATYGLQALLAGGIVGLSAMLLHRRQVPVGLALAWSLAGLTFPTMLWKVAEFGAVPLYVFCLLAAIKAAERGRWVCFTVAWLVALASRQSALLWLALPTSLLLANREAGWGRTLGRLALIAVGGGLIYWAIGQGMNRTNAQAVMQPGIFTQVEWSRSLGHVGLALAVGATAMGLAGFVLRVSTPPTAPGFRQVGVVIVASLAILVLWVSDVRQWVGMEHGMLQGMRGTGYLALVYGLALAGWWWGGFRVRRPFLLVLAAMAGLMALRHSVWDYYLLDVAVLGFFSVSPEAGEPAARPGLRWAGWLALAGVFAFHQSFVVTTRHMLADNHGLVRLHEQALRAGRLSPAELELAPFGYRGWNLYPHSIQHEARGRYIADFEKYVGGPVLRLHVDNAREPAPTLANGKLAAGETLLESEILPRSWFQSRRYNLIRTGTLGAAPEWTLSAYTRPVFPLTDDEWRELIDK
jgi:hypothetical protein